MITLTAAHLEPWSLPLRAPLRTAAGTVRDRQGLLLVLRGEGGLWGVGEVAPLAPHVPEDLAKAARHLLTAAQRLVGRTLEPSAAGAQALSRAVLPSRTPGSVRAGVDAALLDLVGRAVGASVAALLRPNPAAQVAANALLYALDPAGVAAEAAAAVAAGYTTLKLKVGGRPLSDDIARVQAARDAAGPGPDLRLDANASWTPEEAASLLRAVAPARIDYIEDPVDPANLAAWYHLRALTDVRLAWDAGLRTAADLQRALHSGTCDVVILKPAWIGLFNALDLAERAQQGGLQVVITSALDGAVGRAAALHVAAALHLPHAHGLATASLLALDLAAPFAADSPTLPVPDRPGLGLTTLRPLDDLRPDGLHPVAVGDAGISRAGERAVPLPFVHAAQWTPDLPALIADKSAWTAAALLAAADARAAVLWSDGLRTGHRALLQAPNSADLILDLIALWRLGAVPVPIHPRLTPPEVARLRALLPAPTPPADPAAPLRLLDTGAWDAPMAEVFTSGSTGVPTRVALSWGNQLTAALSSAARLGCAPGDRWLAVLPLCHVGGLAVLVRCALLGAAVVLHDRFDPLAVADALVSGEVTLVSLVPTMLHRTLEALGDRRPSPRLRAVLLGGGPIPAPLLEAAAAAGLPVASTFGLTEASSQVATAAPGDPDQRLLPLPLTRLWLEDADAEGVGEIVAAGPTLTGDLWGAPLKTGDFGRLEGGALTVVGRRADRIVTGGENVDPAEVEAALAAHPGIKGVCVVGLDDPELGQRVVAILVPARPDAPPTPAELAALCAARLARFKAPRAFALWPELPSVGPSKLDRRSARADLSRRVGELIPIPPHLTRR